MKATLEDYKNVHNENPEVFNKTILRFRECMCSTKYSVEEKDEMFYSLTQDYLRLKLNESQIQFFMTTKREWEIRSSYEMVDYRKDIKNKEKWKIPEI